MSNADLIIVGGGLAGSEAAWQAAQHGLRVQIYEMRPDISTGAHRTSNLAELVCSNSLGSNLPDRALGILKNELRLLGSLLIECAEATALPAGAALAVDRDSFSLLVSQKIAAHPGIEIVREEIVDIPESLTIIASGPLTSTRLSQSISKLTGEENLHFFDALAPIIYSDSINMDIAYRASRYGASKDGEGDYINCPFSKDEYADFVEALCAADRAKQLPNDAEFDFKKNKGTRSFFEGCLPVEIIAQRSPKALSFGPMRPTGLTNPRTGRWPHALVQLRQDNLLGSLYNLVGFQTNLTFSEQKRVFHMIPGLKQAEFMRYGQMHRNTFISSPNILSSTLQVNMRQNLFFAGQIIGVEGYIGNIGSGLVAGMNAAQFFLRQQPLTFPETTMLGALCHYISHAEPKGFQPMKANFGILPPLEGTTHIDKLERAHIFAERSEADLGKYLEELNLP
jgi:methylenetetrahydrofolate--tRNA-(uracil-5-)-methyltransferase